MDTITTVQVATLDVNVHYRSAGTLLERFAQAKERLSLRAHVVVQVLSELTEHPISKLQVETLIDMDRPRRSL